MLRTVKVPKEFEGLFEKAQQQVGEYFREKKENPSKGTIEIAGERYILVRAASMSVDFFDTVRNLYRDQENEKADAIARQFLFDIAHSIGMEDAKNFHTKMGLKEPVEKLSAGPVHFAYSGWAFVDIFPESRPSPDENYYLIYDHPYSFESDAWLKAGRKTNFPVCVMNAGYSSGWCEESFGIPLVASEITCRAKGDDACRFIMGHHSRIEGYINNYLKKETGLVGKSVKYEIPGFFKRKQMEAVLRESEERFRGAFETAAIGMALVETDGRFQQVNSSLCTMLGYKEDYLRGKRFQDITHPDDLKEDLDRVKELLAGDIPYYHMEKRYIDNTGGIVWGLLSVSLVRNQSGKPLHFVAQIENISARKEAEEKLKHALSLNIATLESTADGLLVTDKKAKLINCNGRFLAMWGVSGEVYAAMQNGEVDFDQEKLFLYVQNLLKEPEKLSSRIQEIITRPGEESFDVLTLKDGRIFERHSRPHKLDEVIIGRVWSFRDITDRVKTEEEILLFRELIDNSNDAVYIIDPVTASFLYVSERACANHGYSREEMLGMRVFDIEASLPEEFSWKTYVKTLKEQRTAIFSGLHRRRDGSTFPVEASVRYVSVRAQDYILAIVRNITDRLKAEESVRRNEAWLRNATRIAHLGTWDWNIRDNTEIWSDEQFRIFGLDPATVVPTYETFLNALYSEDRERVIGELNKSLEEERFYEVECRIVRPGGDIRHVICQGEVQRDDEGKPLRMLGTVLDITERKERENVLNTYRLMVENANDAIFFKDKESRYIIANRKTLEAFGLPEEKVLGKNDYEIMSRREEATKNVEDDLSVFQSGKVRQITKQMTGSDGRKYWFEAVKVPLYEEGGGMSGLVGIARDITERKIAEEFMIESEERFRAITRSVQDAIVTINGEGIVTFWNPAAETITGFTNEEVNGKRLSDLIVPEQFRESYEMGLRAFKESGRGDFVGKVIETTALRKNGEEFPIEVSLSSMNIKREWYAVGSMRDISERKKMLEQLIRAEKLAGIGTFVSGVAHELNNPLTSVVGFSEMLLEEKELPEKLRHTVSIIKEQADRTANIVKNLLQFTRHQRAETAILSMNDLVTNTLELHTYQLREQNVTVITDFSKHLFPVEGNWGHLQQVFMNILLNACYALKENKKERLLKVVTRESGDQVEIVFENNGPSLSSEQREKLFDPFYTTKKLGEGTGLGLSISLGIIEKHGGTITAENISPEGVRFTISLPRAKKSEQSKECEETGKKINKGQVARVLIVEDEANIREMYKAVLEHEGFSVVEAESGSHAVDKLKKKKFELIISDVKMPEMDGYALGEWIRKHKPEMMRKILYVSGIIDPELEKVCEKYNCSVLIKPFHNEALIKAVKRIISQ